MDDDNDDEEDAIDDDEVDDDDEEEEDANDDVSNKELFTDDFRWLALLFNLLYPADWLPQPMPGFAQLSLEILITQSYTPNT